MMIIKKKGLDLMGHIMLLHKIKFYTGKNWNAFIQNHTSSGKIVYPLACIYTQEPTLNGWSNGQNCW